VAARGDDGADVAAVLLHAPARGNGDVVARLLELAHELHVLLDRLHRREVAGLERRADEHVVEGEAEAALRQLERLLGWRLRLRRGLRATLTSG
jgi:hypothetical protein